MLVLPEEDNCERVLVEQFKLKSIWIFGFIAGFEWTNIKMLKSLLVSIYTGDFLTTAKRTLDSSFDAHLNVSVDKLTIFHPLLTFWLRTLDLSVIQYGL